VNSILQQGFEAELKQRLDELGRKVADTMKRSEEQSDIINRLQGTVSASSSSCAWLWVATFVQQHISF